MPQNRFPSRVFSKGEDPDARFSLANERTFLSWIRTSLALAALGAALESIELDLSPGPRLAASIVLLSIAAIGPLHAWIRWCRVETAMREGRPLPSPGLALPVVGAIVVAVILLIWAVLA